jgi:purine-nucleoside/S-methyl-5'-thioadenosine phosphorylase / adenosine deaminase
MDKIIEPLPDKTLAESGFSWREKNGVKVLVCHALEEVGFTNGFSTRPGGVSPFPENDLNLAGFDEDSAENIYENRRRFLYVFDDNYRLATAWQVHGDGVKVVNDDNDIANSEERFDALTSKLEHVLVGVKTADCVPVLLGDPVTRSFAAVHAGWRGTAQSIVIKAVETMKERFDVDPANLIVAIGPAAGCKNYEIGNDVIETFNKNFNGAKKYFREARPGHALIDLHLANKDQLVSAGIQGENIFTAPFCTMERPDLFFSYRLEKSRYGKTGRLMSVIGRKGK